MVAPNAKMSLRASASLPSICSGDMYCSVPTIAPAEVSGDDGLRRVVSVSPAGGVAGPGNRSPAAG